MFVTTTRRPLDTMTSLRRLNSVLDEAFNGWAFQSDENGSTVTSSWLPACDVFEDKDAVKIVAEVPGVRPEDVKISLENNLLTVRGDSSRRRRRPSGCTATSGATAASSGRSRCRRVWTRSGSWLRTLTAS